MNLNSYALSDRPREKLHASGARSLSNAELIAILLNTSGQKGLSVIDLARAMLGTENSLRLLSERFFDTKAKRPKGIGKAKQAMLLSVFEIARRIAGEASPLPARFTSPREIAEHFYPKFRDEKEETCFMLYLDAAARIRGQAPISHGTSGMVSLKARDIFRAALAEHAAGIVLLHNHPSGDPTPSDFDRVVTRQIAETGKQLGIPVIDHVVIGDSTYYSFAEHGLL